MPPQDSAFDRVRRGVTGTIASAFDVEISDEDFLLRMRKRRDEMQRELRAPIYWRWFKKRVLRSGDEVTIFGLELKRLIRLAGLEVPEDSDDHRFHRVPLPAFADLLAKAEDRAEAERDN
jgi:hypothetical protein